MKVMELYEKQYGERKLGALNSFPILRRIIGR